MLEAFLTAQQAIAPCAGLIVMLLDQFDLQIAGVSECDAHTRCWRWVPVILEALGHEASTNEERPDTKSRGPVQKCCVEVAHYKRDLSY
jgi:hypothetical protein